MEGNLELLNLLTSLPEVNFQPLFSTSYTSCIKVNGRPIIPPLMTDELKDEMNKLKKKAIVIEELLKIKQQSERQSPVAQPAASRPSSLDLTAKPKTRSFFMSKLPVKQNFPVINNRTKSSPRMKSTNTSRNIRCSLENQLANRLDVDDSSEINSSYESSSMTTSDVDKCPRNYSPLQVDSLKDLKVKELPLMFNPLEEVDTSTTITPSSPKLLRQGSYTVLTPSPALISYMDSQRKSRKTWDLSTAKKKWMSESDSDFKSPRKKLTPRKPKPKNIRTISCDFEVLKIEGKSSDEDTVPSMKVPYVGKQPQGIEMSMQNVQGEVPSKHNNDDISTLNDLLIKMKNEHERQRKELEERQQLEQEAVQNIFQKLIKSLDTPTRRSASVERCQTADGRYNHHTPNHVSEYHNQRPHSARELNFLHHQHSFQSNFSNSRSHSVELESQMQTPASPFQWRVRRGGGDEDTLGIISDTDCYSDMSSISSEYRQDISLVENISTTPIRPLPRFNIPPGQYEKYSKAASLIAAYSKGYLTRRLLRTVHVQNLITTLRDALSCANQIRKAGDIVEADVELMHRLGRQIEAAWDEVYSVFFNVTTTEKLALISADRERTRSLNDRRRSASVSERRLSSATKKTLQRKQSPMVASYHGSSNNTSSDKLYNRMVSSCDSTIFRTSSCRRNCTKLASQPRAKLL